MEICSLKNQFARVVGHFLWKRSRKLWMNHVKLCITEGKILRVQPPHIARRPSRLLFGY